MRCQHRSNKKKQCKNSIPGNGKWCFLHHPKYLAIIFTKSADWYPLHHIESQLSPRLARVYINRGVAVEITEEMWNDIRKSFAHAFQELQKQIYAPLKNWAQKKDAVAVLQFFGNTEMFNQKMFRNLMDPDYLTSEEINFFKSVVNAVVKK